MKFLFFLLFPISVFAQPTFFGTTSSVADNGTAAGPTVSITPPASMAAGDLVVVYVGYKGGGVTISVSATGGQTWNSELQADGGTSFGSLTLRLFWCRFNGTWGANPSFTIGSGTLAMTGVMSVFRPATSSNTWELDDQLVPNDQNTASTSNFALQVTLRQNSVYCAGLLTNDDNSFTNATGGASITTTAGTAQYRNLQGQDDAMGVQYAINTTFPWISGMQGAWTQSVNGADAYVAMGTSWREVASTSQMKLYLTNTANNLTGTFPSSKQSTLITAANNYSFSGATSPKLMSTTIGTSSTHSSVTGSTVATVSAQLGFVGIWVSQPLSGAQSIGGNTALMRIVAAISESNLAANITLSGLFVYVWRPSTGAKVGNVYEGNPGNTYPNEEPAATSTAYSHNLFDVQIPLSSGLSAVSAADGDVVVIELYTYHGQGTAASYTAGFYYGGNTETFIPATTVTSQASYLEVIGQSWTFQTPSAPPNNSKFLPIILK